MWIGIGIATFFITGWIFAFYNEESEAPIFMFWLTILGGVLAICFLVAKLIGAVE